jgi:phosphate transport system substrate-binding protein
MPRRLFAMFSVVIAAAMLLGACAPAATPAAAPAAPVAPQQVQVTVVVAGTPEIQVITATPDASMVKPTAMPAGSVQINAGGATFPLPLYQQWIYGYQIVDPSVVINYQGIGSGGGKSGILDGTFDFAGSDSLLSADQYKQGADLQMYPIVAGAVVPVYNIKFNAPAAVGAKTPTAAPVTPATLILDRQTLVDIYNAKITMWNDAKIVALNPSLKTLLPAAKITVVHRSDGSGTTEIFTKALTSFSTDWKAGGAQSVQWPVDKAGNGVGGKGNPGVAAAVINTPNSIGYVELDYAIQNSMTFAQLVNKAGKTVTANADSLNAAMADFSDKFTDQLTNTIVDGPSAGSWPIAGYTYMILHTTSMKDCTKAQKIVNYMNWALTNDVAAAGAKKLGYSVLPDAVKAMVLKKLGAVTCSGTPVVAQ